MTLPVECGGLGSSLRDTQPDSANSAGQLDLTSDDFAAVYDEVLVTLETATKTIGRNVCDELYGAFLASVQDYLIDNVRFNIGSRLETAERSRRLEWERAEAAEIKVGILLDAARTGAIWFEEYALMHSAKGTEEGNDKAERNLSRARQLRAAIARASNSASPGLDGEEG